MTDTPEPDTEPATDPKTDLPVPPAGDATDPSDSSCPDPSRPDPDPTGDADARPAEIGGQKGPEPTRYGDWEKKGRCTDF